MLVKEQVSKMTENLILIEPTGKKHNLGDLMERTGENTLSVGRVGSGCLIELGNGLSIGGGRKTQARRISAEEDLIEASVKQISNYHAKIRYDNGFCGWGYYILDVGSTNGTKLNGTPIPTVLGIPWDFIEDGDELTLGTYSLKCQEVKESRSSDEFTAA